MITALDQFKHMFISKAAKTFVVLHGTGGDENDLIPLSEAVNDSYSILSLRGNVNENGMNRFFERYPNMTFNIENIHEEAKKLHTFLTEFCDKNNKSFDDFVFFGYSNGANFALSFLLLYPNQIKNAILLHPMLPFDSEVNLTGTKIFITYGEHDPYSTIHQIQNLKETLEKSNAEITFLKHNGGHEIRREEIEKAKYFLTLQ